MALVTYCFQKLLFCKSTYVAHFSQYNSAQPFYSQYRSVKWMCPFGEWCKLVIKVSFSIPKISSESLKFQKARLVEMIDPFKTIEKQIAFISVFSVSRAYFKNNWHKRVLLVEYKFDVVVCCYLWNSVQCYIQTKLGNVFRRPLWRKSQAIKKDIQYHFHSWHFSIA